MSEHKKPSGFTKIYDAVRRIPFGKVATYGQIAWFVNEPRWARVVGFALHVNPEPGVIPCHRVVNREGRVSNGFAFGGEDAQQRMLEAEGVVFDEEGRIDLRVFGWCPPQE